VLVNKHPNPHKPQLALQKTLPQTSCGPAFKLCLPSELVTRFMSKFIDVDFELRDAVTQRVWQVSIGPRRNKAKFEYLLLVSLWGRGNTWGGGGSYIACSSQACRSRARPAEPRQRKELIEGSWG